MIDNTHHKAAVRKHREGAGGKPVGTFYAHLGDDVQITHLTVRGQPGEALHLTRDPHGTWGIYRETWDDHPTEELPTMDDAITRARELLESEVTRRLNEVRKPDN